MIAGVMMGAVQSGFPRRLQVEAWTRGDVCGRLRTLIEDGEVDKVKEIVEMEFPEAIPAGSEVYLCLHVQMFIELVRANRLESAIRAAQVFLGPFKTAQVSEEAGYEEKAEDQLDRLTASVQQVLAGARMMQLDDGDLQATGGQNNTSCRPRLNSDPLGSEEYGGSGFRSPNSDYEPLDDENLEIIDFLSSLLEKTQMENEDLRSVIIRLSTSLFDRIREEKRRSLEHICVELGVPGVNSLSEAQLIDTLKGFLRPEITCTIEEISAVENAFFEILQNYSQDANVELTLGAKAFALHVQGSTSEMLVASKKRIALTVGESLFLDTVSPRSDLDSGLPTLPPTPTAGHLNCERTIEDLRYRIQFMKQKNLPEEATQHLDAERQRLYRANIAMRKEAEKLESIRAEMEEMRGKLKSQLEDTKALTESLQIEQSHVSQLKLELLDEKTALSQLEQTLEIERSQMELEKAAFIRLANSQSKEVAKLKEKIEEMMKPHSVEVVELPPSPETLPESDLPELEQRVKHLVNLIESEAGDVDHITKELNEIEDILVKVNPRRGGFRRVKVQLTSARNKLVNLKSKLALAQADKMMTNLNSTIRVLGKTWKQQPPLEKVEIASITAPDLEDTLKIGAKSLSKSIDFRSVTPLTNDKLPYSEISAFTDTIQTHEYTIARLQQQLLHANSKLQQYESYESQFSEKEAALRTMERQLEFVSAGLDKKMKQIKAKEFAVKSREISLISTESAQNKSAAVDLLITQVEARLADEDSLLCQQQREVELERLRVTALREETIAKEQSVIKLQQSLSRENLRIEKEKKKLNTMKGDFGRLLPSLETLAKPKA